MRFISAFLAPRPLGVTLSHTFHNSNSSSRTLVCTASSLDSPRVAVSTALFHSYRTNAQVLLIKRGKEPNKDLWSLPGGKREEGESLLDAAKRELFEETSISAQNCHILPNPIDIALVPRQNPKFCIYVFTGICEVGAEPSAGDDAADAMFYRTDSISMLQTVDGLEGRIHKALTAALEGIGINSEIGQDP